jgi:3-oxoadipate enol-lactonase
MNTPASAPMTGHLSYRTVAGVRLRTRSDSGGPTCPTVWLVNGLMMSIEAWDGFIDAFGDGVSWVRYDQRGQGGSDNPAGAHTIESHASDLVQLWQQLHHGSATPHHHFVGLSSGAPAVTLAAAEIEASHPGSVASLTLISGFTRTDAHLRAVVRAWHAAHRVGGPALRFDVATPWVWGHAFLRDQEGALASWREAAATSDPARVDALLAGMAAFAGDTSAALASLTCPVLAIHGRDDAMTPARHGEAIVACAQRGQLRLIPNAGHATPIEAPAAVAAELRPFILGGT